MNKKILLLGFVITSGLFTNGCKKEDEVLPEPSKTDLLTSKTWRYKSITGGGIELIDDCEKDDTYQYSKDNNYTFNDNDFKCTDSQPASGSWSLNASLDTLIRTDAEGIATYKIELLNSTTLILSTHVKDSSNEVLFKETYTAQ